jgi:hypothetical protein
MEPMYYIGLDVHKRKINDCVKDSELSQSRHLEQRYPREVDIIIALAKPGSRVTCNLPSWGNDQADVLVFLEI